jgi:hypothetical protein
MDIYIKHTEGDALGEEEAETKSEKELEGERIQMVSNDNLLTIHTGNRSWHL